MSHFVHFVSIVRLFCACVCRFWPRVQQLALLATAIGALLVTLGMIQVFGGTSLPARIPWALEIGTGVLGLTLVLFTLYAAVVLSLHALLACVALGEFISRKKHRQQKGHGKRKVEACLLKVTAILNQARTGH